jgi:Trk K+ transport system NAD-binding subunit
MLALPNLEANLDALGQLRSISYTGRIAATARFPDEVKLLRQSGATAVFNIYTEAGTGFANHVEAQNQME